MNFLDKYNCIFCKYNKYNKNGDSCFNHCKKDENGYPVEKCKSLSNIYYGKIYKHFPFKQVDDLLSEIRWRIVEKHEKTMDKKYGNCALENDDFKFIWGVKSWDDLTGKGACIYTMNDIEIVYDKKKKVYILDIETAYEFADYTDKCKYLQDCLNAFTKYMDDNGLKKNKPFDPSFANPDMSVTAGSIEDLYTKFKIFVDGFCMQDANRE